MCGSWPQPHTQKLAPHNLPTTTTTTPLPQPLPLPPPPHHYDYSLLLPLPLLLLLTTTTTPTTIVLLLLLLLLHLLTSTTTTLILLLQLLLEPPSSIRHGYQKIIICLKKQILLGSKKYYSNCCPALGGGALFAFLATRCVISTTFASHTALLTCCSVCLLLKQLLGSTRTCTKMMISTFWSPVLSGYEGLDAWSSLVSVDPVWQPHVVLPKISWRVWLAWLGGVLGSVVLPLGFLFGVVSFVLLGWCCFLGFWLGGLGFGFCCVFRWPLPSYWEEDRPCFTRSPLLALTRLVALVPTRARRALIAVLWVKKRRCAYCMWLLHSIGFL